MAPLSLLPSDRYLSLAEREEIALGLARGASIRAIARELGRSPSTISREVRRNGRVRHPGGYRALIAQAKADQAAKRPKTSKLAADERLRNEVQAQLVRRLSPCQIVAQLREDFPQDDQMRISHESIYRSLYVQGRGELRRELTKCLRTGRALRKPRRRAQTGPKNPLGKMLMISERPAEADDRAVPGHWEGDLIMGAHQKSAIGTLVERSTRFVMLLHLPNGHNGELVRDEIVAVMQELPAHLRRSLAWDQGREMTRHAQITLAADLPVYFCDPASPWQRGTNENTNGLLRQYFPKGTDLSVYPRSYLDFVAAELNGRPRKTLGWKTPAKALNELLSDPPSPRVATTA
jgi:IS30 family transposase